VVKNRQNCGFQAVRAVALDLGVRPESLRARQNRMIFANRKKAIAGAQGTTARSCASVSESNHSKGAGKFRNPLRRHLPLPKARERSCFLGYIWRQLGRDRKKQHGKAASAEPRSRNSVGHRIARMCGGRCSMVSGNTVVAILVGPRPRPGQLTGQGLLPTEQRIDGIVFRPSSAFNFRTINGENSSRTAKQMVSKV